MKHSGARVGGLARALLLLCGVALAQVDPETPATPFPPEVILERGDKVIRAVNDRWGTPTYTHDFALNLFKLLDSRQYGTYHMVCEGSGTRYDVAKEILSISGHDDIELVPVESTFFESNYFAPRPISEMMTNANLSALGINFMRPWREALHDYIKREFPHALAGQVDAKKERRLRAAERRKQAFSWSGPERRKPKARRGANLGKQG